MAEEKCRRCRNPVKTVCPEGYCPDCHVSITFTACVERGHEERVKTMKLSNLDAPPMPRIRSA